MTSGIYRGLAVVVAAVAVITIAYALTGSYVSMHYNGTIRAIEVGVYADSSCRSPVYTVECGLIEPGTVSNMTVYIRNEGNMPTKLSLQTANWNPPNASNCISFSWNYSGQTLNVNQAVPVTLLLVVSINAQAITTFSFDAIFSTA